MQIKSNTVSKIKSVHIYIVIKKWGINYVLTTMEKHNIQISVNTTKLALLANQSANQSAN